MDRNLALDLLKLAMSFMIIGLHASFLADIHPLAEYLTVNGIFRVAVPVFLLINGYYFYPVLTKNRARNWFTKLIVMYLIWQLFYGYFWIGSLDFSVKGIPKLLETFLVGYNHLWYLPGIIGAAAILTYVHQLSVKFLITSILATFFIGVLINYLGNYQTLAGTAFDPIFNEHWSHRNMLFFGYPFFCTGFLIRKLSLEKLISREFAFVWSFIGIIALLAESYLNYLQPYKEGGFDNFASLLIACPGIFMAFIKTNIMGSSKEIALYSSAIFFIHMFVLHILWRLSELGQTPVTLLAIVVSAALAAVIVRIHHRFRYIL